MPCFFCVLYISSIFVPQFLYWFLLALSAYFIMYHFNFFSDFFSLAFLGVISLVVALVFTMYSLTFQNQL